MDNLIPALLIGGIILLIVTTGAVIWGNEMAKRDRNRKYWYIARRDVNDQDNVTIAGPFESDQISLKYAINQPLAVQLFQYHLPARDVLTAQKMIVNGAPYVREFQPQRAGISTN